MPETPYLLLIIVVFVFALVLGLLINKYRLGNKVGLLEATNKTLELQLGSGMHQLQEAQQNIGQLSKELNGMLQQHSRNETTIEQLLINEGVLKNSLQQAELNRKSIVNDLD